jgi:hypothetical protein
VPLRACRLRDAQRDLLAGLAEAPEAGFASVAARVRAAAVAGFAAQFTKDVHVPGMPWDGRVRGPGWGHVSTPHPPTHPFAPLAPAAHPAAGLVWAQFQWF